MRGLLLLLLLVLSWAVTTRIVRPQEMTKDVDEPQVGPHKGQIIAVHRLVRSEYKPAPGGIIVEAEASVYDVGPAKPSYFWAVTIREASTGEVFYDHKYRDHALVVDAGEEHHPKFENRFALPPGTYWVSLRLHSLRDNGDKLVGGEDSITVR